MAWRPQPSLPQPLPAHRVLSIRQCQQAAPHTCCGPPAPTPSAVLWGRRGKQPRLRGFVVSLGDKRCGDWLGKRGGLRLQARRGPRGAARTREGEPEPAGGTSAGLGEGRRHGRQLSRWCVPPPSHSGGPLVLNVPDGCLALVTWVQAACAPRAEAGTWRPPPAPRATADAWFVSSVHLYVAGLTGAPHAPPSTGAGFRRPPPRPGPAHARTHARTAEEN